MQTGWPRMRYLFSGSHIVTYRLQNACLGMIYSAIVSKSKNRGLSTPGSGAIHPGGLWWTTLVPVTKSITCFGIRVQLDGRMDRISPEVLPCSRGKWKEGFKTAPRWGGLIQEVRTLVREETGKKDSLNHRVAHGRLDIHMEDQTITIVACLYAFPLTSGVLRERWCCWWTDGYESAGHRCFRPGGRSLSDWVISEPQKFSTFPFRRHSPFTSSLLFNKCWQLVCFKL